MFFSTFHNLKTSALPPPMTALPSKASSTGDSGDAVAADATVVGLTFEDRLNLYWRKHGTLIIVTALLVVVAIVGYGGWQYVAAQQELGIEKEYASASTPERLRAFAEAHRTHTLGGIAHLRMADDAITAANPGVALTEYEKAISVLKSGPLADRARLGQAVARIMAGQNAEGIADLRKIADDHSQLTVLRAEAMYHLASLAAASGTAGDVEKYTTQLMQLDPSSQWAQRAFALRASLPPVAPIAAPMLATPPVPPVQLSPVKK